MKSQTIRESSKQDWSSFLDHVNQLQEAISNGNLKERLNSDDFEGEASVACDSINGILDTVLGVLDNTVVAVEQMSEGSIPKPFQSGFPGDFARAKNACNDFIDVINRRNVQIAKMTEAAMRGDLRIRANVSEFTGVNRRLFESFNSMFDSWLKPVTEIEQALKSIARMDLTEAVDGNYDGEYGRIAETVNQVRTGLIKEVNQIKEHTYVIASTCEELSSVTRTLSEGANHTCELATSAARSSERVSAGLSAVSSGSDQMRISIREISQNASNAAQIVQKAVQVTENTTRKIAQLDESSAQISKVIKVITSIAQQTNLLALNATIEAARAGEAGKGFAVVANEVKELAKGTAKATEEVSQQILAIQRDTRESVLGIADIEAITAEISQISNTIAAAVEEQSVTTNDMGQNVFDVARTASEIASEMGGLADAVRATSTSATHTDAAISELKMILTKLESFVGSFTL